MIAPVGQDSAARLADPREGGPTSCLRQAPRWRPTLRDDDRFTMADLLETASVVTAF